MKDYKPYRFWTRDELFKHLERQCLEFGLDVSETWGMVYDEAWNPMLEYNGCSFIQDKYHPFIACFKHDYNWIVRKGGIEYDHKFRNECIACGVPKARAWAMYTGVRIGWLGYFKWAKMLSK